MALDAVAKRLAIGWAAVAVGLAGCSQAQGVSALPSPQASTGAPSTFSTAPQYHVQVEGAMRVFTADICGRVYRQCLSDLLELRLGSVERTWGPFRCLRRWKKCETVTRALLNPPKEDPAHRATSNALIREVCVNRIYKPCVLRGLSDVTCGRRAAYCIRAMATYLKRREE
jgi:hypothetical protein